LKEYSKKKLISESILNSNIYQTSFENQVKNQKIYQKIIQTIENIRNTEEKWIKMTMKTILKRTKISV